MRLAVLLIFGCGLGVGAWSAGGSQELSASDLRAYYDAHDWFKLREAIAGKEASPLYKGAVAAAFDQVDEAQEALLPLINGSNTSKDADDADDWLSYMFVRTAQYQKAAAQMDEGTPLLATLRTLPDQSVGKLQASTVSCRLSLGRLFVPLAIQGTPVEFFIDSDANFSFVSESEAKNLGLSVQESALKVHGAGGVQSGFRTAVADELTIGNIQLKHVAFMVMPDGTDVFARLRSNEQGAIGLPVLLALRTLRYSKGSIDLAAPSIKVDRNEQNLCFDGLDPVARAHFEQQQLPVVLDTGAAMTEIWPPFARQFSELVNSGKSTSTVENSFGGKSRVPVKLLPELLLGLGGYDLRLHPARVLLAPTTPNSQRYYGRIGLDALLSTQEVTIDFSALKLTIR
jgi:predicted aspartyl protease